MTGDEAGVRGGTDDGASAHGRVRAARDLLLDLHGDPAAAYERFRWPRLATFNWALDWFDEVAARPGTAERTALRVVAADGSSTSTTYAQMSARSTRLAGWLRARGVRRHDRVLLVLGNQVELWETLLACAKLGAVVVPATTLLSAADVADRVARAGVRHVVARSADAQRLAAVGEGVTRIAVGDPVPGWLHHGDARASTEPFAPDGPTSSGDALLLYSTSGTTARPKLVEHTHASYPVGHLSTMHWIGLRPGDVHLNVSSPGWAKHAWSNVFAPWLAEASVLVVDQPRFSAEGLLAAMADCAVTTFCAPPTVWRMLVQTDLAAHRGRLRLREVVGAGEPLNPEVVEQVRRAWGLTVRDGFGQTETTAQVGNPPGAPLVPGSMGRPLPGYDVVLLDAVSGEERTGEGAEGELCLRLDGPLGRPLGLMAGYRDDEELTATAVRGGAYHTGDVARRDASGAITYVGRSDDVFKASDYRISPFELESVLLEHEAVAEAAVVPSPDPVRLAVPKAYVVLAAGHAPDAATAEAVLRRAREHLPPYQRVRCVEFTDLPRTISGKIRRVELRAREQELHGDGADRTARASGTEFWEDDLPGLRR